MVSAFYDILNNIINNFVPRRKPRNPHYPIWFSRNLIKIIKEKDRIRNLYRKFRNPRDQLEYELLRERCHKLIEISYRKYCHSIESDIIKNPATFFRHIKNKRKGASKFPADMNLDNTTASTSQDVANLFATHFSSVYSREDFSYNQSNFDYTSNKHIASVQFTEAEVLNKLKKLDSCKGAGPDNIPPFFIKRCKFALALPLTLIFNQSLTEGCFPDKWKLARIVPIYKNNDQSNIKNYRPISILSCFPKIFESLLYPFIYNLANDSISEFQHGFRSCHSVESNLVSFISEISNVLDKCSQIDTIYTDFSNAFDKVNHTVLISKLEAFGMDGSLLSWFKSYLSKRPQIVVVNGFESNIFFAKSGVPQGSHLGPLLFLIFINDITKVIQYSSVSMFADDLKIYRNIQNDSDVKLLQSDVDRIDKWCTDNGMKLNIKKCQTITFSRKQRNIDNTYTINGNNLHSVLEIRDLGVTLDSKLKYDKHIDIITKKASQMLGFIKRNSKDFRQSKTKVILYNSLVRSHLEFASVAWNPVYSNSSQRIESIQRAFTRYLAISSSGIPYRTPYPQRLRHFKMITLRNRRMLSDVLFLHRLINYKVRCAHLLSQIKINIPHKYPRFPKTKILSVPHCRTNLALHSPIPRMCSSYNTLTSKLDLDLFCGNLIQFKKQVINHVSQF